MYLDPTNLGVLDSGQDLGTFLEILVGYRELPWRPD